jgi:dolichol-phosphate mannosyltransferase
LKSAVVIPTYNEAENLPELVAAIAEAMPELDVIIVDDNSPDGTGDVAESLGVAYVLRRAGKLGLGTAYVEGFTYALEQDYDRIGGMDADFSHPPDVLPALFGLLDEFDLGLGVRYVPGGGTKNWGLHRRILSRTANGVARVLLGMPVHDCTGAFRAFKREVLESIELSTIRSTGYSFLVEMLHRCVSRGFSVGEVPIIFEDRRHGASKMDRGEIIYGIMNLFRIRFRGQ